MGTKPRLKIVGKIIIASGKNFLAADPLPLVRSLLNLNSIYILTTVCKSAKNCFTEYYVKGLVILMN